MQDDFQNQAEEIRAGDFRKAWPAALGVAMRQASELISQLEQTNRSITETKDRVVGLAKLVPTAIEQAEGRLNLAVSEVTSQIVAAERRLVEASHASIAELNRALGEAQTATLELNMRLTNEQQSFLAELKNERLALVRSRSDADAAFALVVKLQQNLETEKRLFNSRSPWQKIFKKS